MIVIDDCITYGVSIGVAAAILRKAGAAMITGIALGKFGNSSNYYEIEINSDPFEPIYPNMYKVALSQHLMGVTSGSAQSKLCSLIP